LISTFVVDSGSLPTGEPEVVSVAPRKLAVRIRGSVDQAAIVIVAFLCSVGSLEIGNACKPRCSDTAQ
jgi:hypothetical protein